MYNRKPTKVTYRLGRVPKVILLFNLLFSLSELDLNPLFVAGAFLSTGQWESGSDESQDVGDDDDGADYDEGDYDTGDYAGGDYE